MAKLRATKGQHKNVQQCNPGVGLLILNLGGNSSMAVEVYVLRGQLRYVANGKLVNFADIGIMEDD